MWYWCTTDVCIVSSAGDCQYKPSWNGSALNLVLFMYYIVFDRRQWVIILNLRRWKSKIIALVSGKRDGSAGYPDLASCRPLLKRWKVESCSQTSFICLHLQLLKLQERKYIDQYIRIYIWHIFLYRSNCHIDVNVCVSISSSIWGFIQIRVHRLNR